MTKKLVSPAATGDRGGTFQQHVSAAFLVYLLTKGSPPFLRGSQLTEVHFQAGHRKWKTEDILMIGTGSQGAARQVAIQVKSSFTFGINKECQEVFTAAWTDFTNTDLFDSKRDGLAVVTGQLPVAAQQRWRIVLDAARASISAADWLNRLSLAAYHEKGAGEALELLRDLLDRAKQSPVSDDDLP